MHYLSSLDRDCQAIIIWILDSKSYIFQSVHFEMFDYSQSSSISGIIDLLKIGVNLIFCCSH
jgi:hypothetical protein